MAPTQRDVFLVIGGSGFLGRHLVEALLDRGDSVAVMDLVQRHHDVPFHSADVTDQIQVSKGLQKVCIVDLVVAVESVLKQIVRAARHAFFTLSRHRTVLKILLSTGRSM